MVPVGLGFLNILFLHEGLETLYFGLLLFDGVYLSLGVGMRVMAVLRHGEAFAAGAASTQSLILLKSIAVAK